MKSADFSGKQRIWSPDEVKNRDRRAKRGPKLAGVGLAQWTAEERRKLLFESKLGTEILFSMEGQIAYLVHELQNSYKEVDTVLTKKGVTVNDAADAFVYGFEKPASVLTSDRKKLKPKSSPSVQDEFAERRALAKQALDEYRESVTED